MSGAGPQAGPAAIVWCRADLGGEKASAGGARIQSEERQKSGNCRMPISILENASEQIIGVEPVHADQMKRHIFGSAPKR
jgi:hypothetical protein